MGCLFLLSYVGLIIMSDAQNEISNLKNMLIELTQRVEDAAINSEMNTHRNIVNNADNSKLYLSISKLKKELEEVSSKNRILNQEVTSLKIEKINLEYENNKITEENDHYAKQMEQHEKRNRKFFELYSKDKEEVSNYKLLIERFRQEIVRLEETIEKQEQRYDNLKNQLSYKLGSRLVGLRKSKDLLSLPKTLLDDYIAVKSKANNLPILTSSIHERSSASKAAYNFGKQCTLFNDSATLPAKSKISTIIFNKDFRGPLDVQLYGVKASISVDIELTIRVHEGDCTLKLMPDFKNVQYIRANEVIKTKVTISDHTAHNIIEIMSTTGTVEVSFKKTRGVPSFLHFYTGEKDSGIVPSSYPIDYESKMEVEPSQIDIVLPKLKQRNGVFTEAWDINQKLGFAAAKLFVEKQASKELQSTLYIFEANGNLDNEDKWLNLLNEYIKKYNMHPITLRNGDEAKYYRIASDVDYTINDSTKISVIMPAFNAEKTIELAMHSILNQTWKNLELIVINDCSTDDTFALINKVASMDKRVKVIDNPCNVGAYVSKNLGLKIASGDYITGHDSDDWAHPQRLEQHYQLIQLEELPPRASNTRMIRMEENGYLPIYKTSNFCHDGVLRIASITCMFEVNFLRYTLGGWDCARFGADSEIISRCEMFLGEEFKNYELLSMVCLDEPTSLTNDPLHGISKTTGISPTRKFYKDQWIRWQKTLEPTNVYLSFPHLNRKFDVPENTEIPEENIIKAIRNVEVNNLAK